MKRPPLTDAEFGELAGLLHRTAGLAFDETRRDSLAYSVNERMRASGCHTVADYLRMLADPSGAGERQALLDEVTIPETHFFRNPPQIRALRKHVLPELVPSSCVRPRVAASCGSGAPAARRARSPTRSRCSCGS